MHIVGLLFGNHCAILRCDSFAAKAMIRIKERSGLDSHLIDGRRIALGATNQKKITFVYEDSHHSLKVITRSDLEWLPASLTVLPDYIEEGTYIDSSEYITNIASLYIISHSLFNQVQSSDNITLMRDILSIIHSDIESYQSFNANFTSYIIRSRNSVIFVSKRIVYNRVDVADWDRSLSYIAYINSELEKDLLSMKKTIDNDYAILYLDHCYFKYYARIVDISLISDSGERESSYNIRMSLHTLCNLDCDINLLPREIMYLNLFIYDFAILRITKEKNISLERSTYRHPIKIEKMFVNTKMRFSSKVGRVTTIANLYFPYKKNLLKLFIAQTHLAGVHINNVVRSQAELIAFFMGEVETIHDCFMKLHDGVVLDFLFESLNEKEVPVLVYNHRFYIFFEIKNSKAELVSP